MKPTIWLAAILLLTVQRITAQDTTRNISKECFANETITGIKACGTWAIVLRQGDETGVRLEADERLEPYLTIRMDKGELTLDMKKLPVNLRIDKNQAKKRWSKRRDRATCDYPLAVITVSELQTLTVAGQCRFTTEGILKTDLCSIRLKGKAKTPLFRLESAGIVSCTLDGNSKLYGVNIHAPQVNLKIFGAAQAGGRVEADRLGIRMRKTSRLSLSGSAQAKIAQHGTSRLNFDNMQFNNPPPPRARRYKQHNTHTSHK